MALCECGCGQETTIYRGKHRRFIKGHQARTQRNNPSKTCRVCGVELTGCNTTPSRVKLYNYICNTCEQSVRRSKRQLDIQKARAYAEHSRRKNGVLSISENKKCSKFLGVHIAESVLCHVFKDVEVMPTDNHGFDFICNRGKKIDVKSSCSEAKSNASLR